MFQKTTNFDMKNLEKTELKEQEKGREYEYKKDRIVIFFDLTEADFKQAKVFKKDENLLIRHVAFAMEALELKEQTSWKCASRMILIYDFSKLTMKHYYAAYKAGITKVLQVLSGNYPESSDKIYILNPPLIFSWCFKMVKPFLEPDTILKIKLLRGEKDIKKAMEKEAIDTSRFPKSTFKDGTDDPQFEYILDDKTIEFSKQEEGSKNRDNYLELLQTLPEIK